MGSVNILFLVGFVQMLMVGLTTDKKHGKGKAEGADGEGAATEHDGDVSMHVDEGGEEKDAMEVDGLC